MCGRGVIENTLYTSFNVSLEEPEIRCVLQNFCEITIILQGKTYFAQKYSFNKGTCFFLLAYWYRTVLNTGLHNLRTGILESVV
jgi:hypothetical protein